MTAHSMMEPVHETTCAVLIIGAGPTGLFLAALLARRGVDVQVLERRTAPTAFSRAIGLHPPALRALAELGLDREAVSLGEPIHAGSATCRQQPLGRVDFTRAWPGRPFVLALPQSRTETLLAQRLAQLAPAALRRGWEVTDLQETARTATVTARRSDGEAGLLRVRAGVVLGTDGARSRVRDLLGIPADGREYPDTYLMGDLADPAAGNRAEAAEGQARHPQTGRDGRAALIHLEPGGVVESFPIPGGLRRWVVHTGTGGAEPSATRLVALIRERTGTVLDPATTSMLSAFTVRRRTARRLLTRRCVLLGDAAHEISPIGGQGITLGWLDALDLAPLLARRPLGPLRADPAWRGIERRILRRARIAGALAGVNTALGRPAGPRLSALRARAVRSALRTPLRRTLAWAYSMGWVRWRGPRAR